MSELRKYRDDVGKTLIAIHRLNPEFVSRSIGQLAIRAEYRNLADKALLRAKEILRSV